MNNDAVCNALPIGIFALDADLRIRFWNRWLEDHTRIRERDALLRTLSELYPGFRNPRFELAVAQTIRGHGPQILSQALHHYLIPIDYPHLSRHGIGMMRQHVHIEAAEFDGETAAIVSVCDVTGTVLRAGALTDAVQRLEQDVNRDTLTGLYNRRFMWEWLDQQYKQAERHGYLIAALVVDLDNFKQINDRLGHQVGDRALKLFADILRECTRESDIAVRYGGDEFLLLLPGCNLEMAREVGARVVERSRMACCDGTGPGDIACSIGIALFDPENPILASDLVSQADSELYRAKQAGGSRVICSAG